MKLVSLDGISFDLSEDTRVRVLSQGRHFVGHCSHRLAVAAVRDKRAKVIGRNKNRLLAIIDLTARVDAQIPSAKPFTYREQLADTHSVTVLMRLDGAGNFHRWDQNLTFKELRAGRILSETTVIARAEARAFRAQA